MSFAVTSFEAFGREIDEPLTTRFDQWLVLNYTGLAADVALDLGAAVSGSLGTFWTAALADGTPANAAAAALALQTLQSIVPLALNSLSPDGPTLSAKARQVVAATGGYSQTVVAATKTPSIAIFAGEGVTSGTVYLKWDLKKGSRPVKYPTV